MSTYTIINTYESNEQGYVYADVLINDEVEPRKLILPDDPKIAQNKMADYLYNEDNPVIATNEVITKLDVLIDKPQEVI